MIDRLVHHACFTLRACAFCAQLGRAMVSSPRSSASSTAFGERTGLSVAFDATLDERLPEDVESALYRLVQEALTKRRQARVCAQRQRRARSPERVARRGRGGRRPRLRLRRPRARAAVSGSSRCASGSRSSAASLEIESAIGAGTTLRATIDLP
jgi:hypothetical protein